MLFRSTGGSWSFFLVTPVSVVLLLLPLTSLGSRISPGVIAAPTKWVSSGLKNADFLSVKIKLLTSSKDLAIPEIWSLVVGISGGRVATAALGEVGAVEVVVLVVVPVLVAGVAGVVPTVGLGLGASLASGLGGVEILATKPPLGAAGAGVEVAATGILTSV